MLSLVTKISKFHLLLHERSKVFNVGELSWMDQHTFVGWHFMGWWQHVLFHNIRISRPPSDPSINTLLLLLFSSWEVILSWAAAPAPELNIQIVHYQTDSASKETNLQRRISLMWFPASLITKVTRKNLFIESIYFISVSLLFSSL